MSILHDLETFALNHRQHGNREIRRVTQIAWDQAVNDTANLWQSVFWNALGPKRAWDLYGIAAPLKAIEIGSHC